MMTNNPNANLIEAMKEKLPLKGQLADMLMDTLYIGKEAVYRRLRGEVPFTLQESALISRKLGISLDKIIGLSFKSNAMFNINIVDYDDPFESYYNILEKYVSLINTMPDDPNSVMGTSANIIPQTLYLKHELLANSVYSNGCTRINISIARVSKNWIFHRNWSISRKTM